MSIPEWSPPADASLRQRRQWRKDMQIWIGSVLDWRTETRMNAANKRAVEESVEDYLEQSAIYHAHYGDIEPLRKRHPRIAQFIHLPREGHRGKYPRRSSGTISSVEAAVEAAAFVKLFWREVYGHRNRRREDDMSAEAVVARHYNDMGFVEVTEAAIKKRARKYRIRSLVAVEDAELARSLASSIGR